MSHVKVENAASQGKTLVMKFGGTSVGEADSIGRVVEITKTTQRDWPQLVVITSAMSGVTTQLLESAERAAAGDQETFGQVADDIAAVHRLTAAELIKNSDRYDRLSAAFDELLKEFRNLCSAVCVLGEATPRALDTIAGLGERLMVRLLAAALREVELHSAFVEATRVVVTDSRFQDAHPDLEETRQRAAIVLAPLLATGCVPVVTGFLGATPEGVTTTLGRGGSDYSAAIIAAVLQANEVWIWTDVDGVMTADPRIVSNARTLDTLSYREVAELAYFGAQVLHPKTIRPVIEAGIDLRVRNTFNPHHAGTRVVARSLERENGAVKAVTAIRGQRLITIEGRGMLGVPGVAGRAFSAVADTGTSVILITQASSEQSICFSVPDTSVARVIEALEKTFALELANRDIDRIWSNDDSVIVTVVGAGMRDTPGVAGRVFGALGDVGVNVVAIAQGSSEAAISLVVKADDLDLAVRALHELILKETDSLGV